MNEKEAHEDAKDPSAEELGTENERANRSETQQPAGEEAGLDENKAAGPADESAEQQVAELTAKCAELNDQYLRKAADFENFRKRMLKEKQESIDFANQNLLLDLIPVLDDFERALKAAEDTGRTEPDFHSLCEGVTMIGQRLRSTLENKWGLKQFDSKNVVFDPERHEALMVEKSAEVTEATVQEDFAKGYMLKDRVVRTAKVKVLMPLEG